MNKTHRLTREEREVHIWLNEIDNFLEIDCSVPKWNRRLKRLGYLPTSEDSFGGATYRIPTRALTIRRASSLKPTSRRTAHLTLARAARTKPRPVSIDSASLPQSAETSIAIDDSPAIGDAAGLRDAGGVRS
jgi:hypothetical protein